MSTSGHKNTIDTLVCSIACGVGFSSCQRLALHLHVPIMATGGQENIPTVVSFDEGTCKDTHTSPQDDCTSLK